MLPTKIALDVVTAEKLTSDSDAYVRLDSLMTLVENGNNFTDDQVKNILVRPNVTGFATLLGGGSRATDNDGEACWKKFKEQKLTGMKIRDLEKMARTSTIFDHYVEFMLIEKQFFRCYD